MDFVAVVDQAIALLRQRGRLTYRTLQRQFHLDDAALDALKDELIDGQRLAVDEAGKVLVWAGAPEGTTPAAAAPAGTATQAPLVYTPAYLAEKILTSRSALEGERKQVTVLFADLKGSMELLADRDPEEARQLLDPVLERMMAAVHRYEGTVNQVMGDGIMALFGAPLAHEDHAVRACYAALAMQAAIETYAEEARRAHGITVQMRVGLHSGAVVVRAIGNDLHMDYSAVGQTTHLAARMEQLATPGHILLTADTLRLVEGLVQVTALGPIPVKGLPAPVEVFDLVGANTLRGRFQARVAGGLTRFVGRDTELAALVQALARAGAGHGQVVAVVGEAGVGKSRLAYEVLHSHHTQGWRVLESTAVSYGRAAPSFPVIDLLKRYCHLEERDDPRMVRAKVTGQVLTLDETLQDTLPALLALLEVLPDESPFRQLDPPQRRQRTLAALKRVLLRESQVQPLLVVFEDLHWIDSETQALLDSLVESLPTARLLLLVNYRPEYQHSWGSKTYYAQLRLDPLPPVSAHELLHALLGDDPSLAPLPHLLMTRAEGNPFFLEESVRTLVETGVLVGVRGTYRLAHALPSIQVPATVQAMLAARIDRLPPEEKRLLQTAAVIGTEVPLPLLQAIAEMPEEVLYRGLAHVQAAEFLYETRLFPERELTFKHALTHDVAYGSLLHERRRALHSTIVAAIERLDQDRVGDHVERLAHHALRGEVWDKAVAYCRQAGVKATERSAYQEAVAYLEQALAALRHLPDDRATLAQAIDLRLHLRPVLTPLGRVQQALDLLREAEAYAEDLHDQRRLGQVVFSMVGCWWLLGTPERAVEYGERACALAAALGDVVLQMRATLPLGQAYATMGDYRRAADYLSRTMDAPQDARPSSAFRVNHYACRHVPRLVGVEPRRIGCVCEGHGRRGGSPPDGRGGWTPLHDRRRLLRHGLCPPPQRGPRPGHPGAGAGPGRLPGGGIHSLSFHGVAAFLGAAYVLAGRVAEALPLLEQVVTQTDAMGVVFDHVLGMIPLGEGYLRAGRIADALQQAQQAVDVCRQHHQRGHEAWALRLLGAVATRGHPPEVAQATGHYQQALTLAEALGMRPLVAHCHYGLGTLYSATGQREQARTALSTAIEMYQAMEMTFWLPQTEAALAQVEER